MNEKFQEKMNELLQSNNIENEEIVEKAVQLEKLYNDISFNEVIDNSNLSVEDKNATKLIKEIKE